jgi:hypothetical protein
VSSESSFLLIDIDTNSVLIFERKAYDISAIHDGG